jgi:hypothetical protein
VSSHFFLFFFENARPFVLFGVRVFCVILVIVYITQSQFNSVDQALFAFRFVFLGLVALLHKNQQNSKAHLAKTHNKGKRGV